MGKERGMKIAMAQMAPARVREKKLEMKPRETLPTIIPNLILTITLI